MDTFTIPQVRRVALLYGFITISICVYYLYTTWTTLFAHQEAKVDSSSSSSPPEYPSSLNDYSLAWLESAVVGIYLFLHILAVGFLAMGSVSRHPSFLAVGFTLLIAGGILYYVFRFTLVLQQRIEAFSTGSDSEVLLESEVRERLKYQNNTQPRAAGVNPVPCRRIDIHDAFDHPNVDPSKENLPICEESGESGEGFPILAALSTLASLLWDTMFGGAAPPSLEGIYRFERVCYLPFSIYNFVGIIISFVGILLTEQSANMRTSKHALTAENLKNLEKAMEEKSKPDNGGDGAAAPSKEKVDPKPVEKDLKEKKNE